MNTIEKKLTEFKALLGDEAAKTVLEEAEAREKTATEAGVQVKEKKVTTKADEKAEPTKLSDLLAEVNKGIEAGEIEDDLGLAEEDPGDENPEGDEPVTVEAIEKAVGEMVTKAVDAAITSKFKALEDKVETRFKSFVPRGEEVKKQRDELAKTLKETQDKQVDLQTQLDELNGVSPRRNRRGFRASQAESTVTEKGKEDEAPVNDNPIDAFIGNLGILQDG